MRYGRISVGVVLSTYNGERFLREQLDSILAQENVHIKLFIRDDGSVDSTPEIIRESAEKYGDILFLNPGERRNLGVLGSFLFALGEAVKDPLLNYFAFSDQDDVWMKDKIAAAVEMLSRANADADKPALYYSNKTFVDREQNVIAEEHIQYYGDFYEILFPSLASGCTMVFNRALAERAIRGIPQSQDDWLHDSWLYRSSKVLDSAIVFDEQSHIFYRQHDANVAGRRASRVLQWPNILRGIFKKPSHRAQGMLRELCETYGDAIPPQERKRMEWVFAYNHDPRILFKLATAPEMLKRGPVLYIVWLGRLLFHRL